MLSGFVEFFEWLNSLARHEDRVQDPLMAGLQAFRTTLGLVATVWLLVAYPITEGGEQFVLGKAEDLVVSGGITFAVALVAMIAFVAAARAPLSGRYAARLVGPARSIGLILLSAGAVWLLVELMMGNIITPYDFGHHGILLSLLILAAFGIGWVACLIGVVFAVVLTLVALIAGVNSCFALGEVHEILPALVSPLLVWTLLVINLFEGPDVAAPPSVLYTFLLGGPVSVTLLSVWEIRRLRTRHGVTLRVALGR
ncbi:hypothetical protein [Streptomyces sp. NPDC127190]|uniref:hypothetical protein n=1 Tax=unclassified Streptomyces TaxID=2593676 RepID=UPI003643A393